MDEFEANLRRVRGRANEFETNLSHIKSQGTYPFLHYKVDNEEYMYAELYWLNLFKAVVGDNENKAWIAWLPPDTVKEGNPLFSVINYKTRRALRIIHIFSQMEEAEIAQNIRRPPAIFYSECKEDEWGNDPWPHTGHIFELAICSDISEESEKIARKFVHLFCVKNAPMNDVEREIKEYEEEFFPNAPLPEEE